MTHICRIAAPSSSATTVARKITTRAAVQFPAKTMESQKAGDVTRQEKKAGGGTGGQTWCSGHKKTTPSDTEYYVQGAQRPQTTASTHMAAVVSVDTKKRPTINFDNDFDKVFQF